MLVKVTVPYCRVSGIYDVDCSDVVKQLEEIE